MIASPAPLRAAEFFAGIGLVRLGLEAAGIEVAWANDIEPLKYEMYAENFDAAEFVLGDVSKLTGADLPATDIATASFPCTDLSLAGYRRGLAGKQSGMFWEFARLLEEQGDERPRVVLLENVPSFATSHGGEDLRAAILRLNELGYSCDVFQLDAREFVPQSRPRLFLVAALDVPAGADAFEHPYRGGAIASLYANPNELVLHAFDVPLPGPRELTLPDCVERLRPRDCRWWEPERVDRFMESLSPLNVSRINMMRLGSRYRWATAYRRTREGVARWEIRNDDLAGCLRTARGGSSKQAVVQAGRGTVRVRWMTPQEYATLQGAPGFKFASVSTNRALFGFGDAVCVPAVGWIAEHYLRPLATGELTTGAPERVVVIA